MTWRRETYLPRPRPAGELKRKIHEAVTAQPTESRDRDMSEMTNIPATFKEWVTEMQGPPYRLLLTTAQKDRLKKYLGEMKPMTYTRTYTREELALKYMLEHRSVLVASPLAADKEGLISGIERRVNFGSSTEETYVHVVFDYGSKAYGVLVPLGGVDNDDLKFI